MGETVLAFYHLFVESFDAFANNCITQYIELNEYIHQGNLFPNKKDVTATLLLSVYGVIPLSERGVN